MTKQKYVPARLTLLGKVQDLTLGASGAKKDAQSNMA